MTTAPLSILFVTNNYTPYTGGVVSSIDACAQELRAQGHTVTIVTLDFFGVGHEHADVIRLWCPIRFVYKSNRVAVPLLPTWQLIRIMKKLKPDIVHLHHPFLLGRAAAYAAHLLKIPTVFTYHTLYEMYAHYVPAPLKVVQKITRYLVLFFCRHVTHIIAPSTFVDRHVRAAGIHNVQVIPSPILPIFLSAESEVKRTIHTPIRLLSVSRFTPEKNIEQLLLMLKIVHIPWHCTLVGYGYWADRLQKMAFQDLQLPKNQLQFVFKPSKDELISYYQRSDLFIFASQTETQGLVLAESMSLGLPVIALAGPGQEDIIVDRQNGFLVDDIHTMAKTIEMVAHTPEQYAQLSTAAYATGKKYHPRQIIEKLVKVYADVI